MQYLIVFLEGIITFVSPCLLPMLPVYISYFTAGEQKGTRKAVKNSVFFVLGFTAVFVLLGLLAGAAGAFLQKYSVAVNIVTGGFVFAFGLSYLGVFRMPFIARASKGTHEKKQLNAVAAFLFGAAFSLGWTPCIGAFLGSALMLASQQGSALQGLLMLLCYSAGLGIPFIISAAVLDKLKGAFDVIKKHYKIINTVCGAALCVMGVLMMTGLMNRILGMLAV